MNRLVAAALLFSGATFAQSVPQDGSPDALARHVCTSEGMWCQDAKHSRCCRGLKCENSTCKKPEHDEGGKKSEKRHD